MNNHSVPKEKEITLSGIRLRLSRKKIKNAYIYVKPPNGEVFVSAPNRMSLAEIERFVASKREWIIKNSEKLRSLPHNEKSDADAKDGDILYIWGKPYIIKIMENAGSDGFEISEIFIKLKFKGSYEEKDKERLLKKMYAGVLREQLALRVPVWENRTGLKCSSWTVRRMTSRWGSCNIRTKKLNFNTRLAEKKPEYLEYVILHELAHTKVANHGSEFKAILDEFMPNWKKLRREM